ncbi:hypothetical protein EJV47_11040 [Hymenobacter gummosus]|uniref:Uncharacterized protein n=1 Tax=Hymenobacter gummosus TaxID=1776032 RepID=A0A431U3H7_9BACT|nr:hypothetical protein [Hymenobacter gummosus]RTQ50163.1 hypothetical protein EJV47_11040 [Hymenobacter gummosus]
MPKTKTSNLPAAAPANLWRRGKGHVRPPHEGNRLWQLYCEMGRTRAAVFRELLRASAIKLNTFTSDTARQRQLGSIAAGRLQVYRDFFLADGVDLYEVMRAERGAPPAHDAAR